MKYNNRIDDTPSPKVLSRLLTMDFDHPVFQSYLGGRLLDPMEMTRVQAEEAVRRLDEPLPNVTDAAVLLQQAIKRQRNPSPRTLYQHMKTDFGSHSCEK